MFFNLYAVMLLHFVGDFLLQPRKIAKGKGSDVKLLLIHCIIYSAVMCFAGIRFGIAAGLFHFITDFITSKLTTGFWKQNKEGLFWSTIGADQTIHTLTLIALCEVLAK